VQHVGNLTMNLTLTILTLLTFTNVFSQNQPFRHDTLWHSIDESKNVEYTLGETWYLLNNDTNQLTFTKEFTRDKSKMKFEFDDKNVLYMETGLLSCGDWTMGYWTRYELADDKLNIIKIDSIVPEQLLGQFDISEYSKTRMILVKQ